MNITTHRAAGVFITVEGIDGAGKTSHIEGVAQRWREAGRTCVRTREPGGTPLAERLRDLLLNAPMDAVTEALLAFAARRDHLSTVIEPALQAGSWVLCDRFSDATFAYQGHGHGVSLEALAALEAWVQAGRQPDLTLVFDLDPAVAAERLAAARQPDRFESLDAAFFARVRQGYLKRVAQTPARYAVIDAGRPPDDVAWQVQQALTLRGWW